MGLGKRKGILAFEPQIGFIQKDEMSKQQSFSMLKPLEVGMLVIDT